jgi:ApbE superfamily uncharacterized protein (UPF0280 family)
VKTEGYQPRTYREWVRGDDLVSFEVVLRETDLQIRATRNLRARALRAVTRERKNLEEYIKAHPVFLTTLEPLEAEAGAPRIIQEMCRSASVAGVGPMASVAGAVAEEVGNELLKYSPEVIIENGGDIYMKTDKERLVGVFAGDSPFTGRIALKIEPGDTPLGIATSSGTVGHSLSFGKADAAMILAESAYLADAAATALGNRVKKAGDIRQALDWAQKVPGLLGALVIIGKDMGAWGKIELVEV